MISFDICAPQPDITRQANWKKNIRNLEKYIPCVFKETKASFQQHISEKKSKGMFSVFRFDLNST